MSFYASFQCDEAERVFRSDTRIYISGNPSQSNEVCVAAIVGKNHGSATGCNDREMGEMNLNGDKLLPSVKNRFADAYLVAGKKPLENAFVQVWNLFYLCDKNLKSAIQTIGKINRNASTCQSEMFVPSVVWFAWGGPHSELDRSKSAF